MLLSGHRLLGSSSSRKMTRAGEDVDRDEVEEGSQWADKRGDLQGKELIIMIINKNKR